VIPSRSHVTDSKQGIDATFISLHDVVASAYGDDLHKEQLAYNELGPRFFDALSVEIGNRIDRCGETVPIITGKSRLNLYMRTLIDITKVSLG